MLIVSLEQHIKVFALAFWQLSDEVSVLLIFNLLDKLVARVSKQLGYHVELVLLRTCWEEWLSNDQLSKNAAHRPNIDLRVVLLPR